MVRKLQQKDMGKYVNYYQIGPRQNQEKKLTQYQKVSTRGKQGLDKRESEGTKVGPW